ncbi:MAG: hypothetical protein RR840_02640 [Clostridium sp.]
MSGLMLLSIIVGIIGIVDILLIIKNKILYRNEKITTLYKFKYESILLKIAVVGLIYIGADTLLYLVGSGKRDFNIYYNIVIPGVLVGYFVFKKLLVARIGEEGILLPRGIFIAYSSISKVEINITPYGKRYTVKVICNKYHLENILITKDFLDTFIELIQIKTTAEISRIYKQFEVTE